MEFFDVIKSRRAVRKFKPDQVRREDLLKILDALGVDGVEGVDLGLMSDVSLEEAFAITSNKFILTGGVSASQIRELPSREEAFEYARTLFRNLKRYSHRFMFSASPPIDASFSTIRALADAWYEYR
jgi:hypothetical protein